MRICLFAAVVAASVSGSAVAQRAATPPSSTGVSMVPDDDAAMSRAIARAKQTLPQFVAMVQRPPSGFRRPSVKVGMPTPRGVEFIWVDEPLFTGERVDGVVANNMEMAPTPKRGDHITFKQSDIADWMYRRSGTIVGNYTGCAIVSEQPPAERKAMELEYHLDCSSLP